MWIAEAKNEQMNRVGQEQKKNRRLQMKGRQKTWEKKKKERGKKPTLRKTHTETKGKLNNINEAKHEAET